MRQSFVAQLVQPLQRQKCNMWPHVIVEKDWTLSVDQCWAQPLKFLMHFIDLLDILRHRDRFTRIQEARLQFIVINSRRTSTTFLIFKVEIAMLKFLEPKSSRLFVNTSLAMYLTDVSSSLRCITSNNELRQKKQGADRSESRKAVPGVDGNLLFHTGSSVAATCLPGSGEEASTVARCLTAGWEETGAGKEELAARLQQAEISLLSHEAYASYWGQNTEETNICRRAVGTAFFMGDSGWLLICQIDGHYKLVGIASWGHEKCCSESPVVYSSVSAYWISSVANQNV
ncbi:transmembrane protease serine 3-like [Athene cunicularia]|uniref:transmembrane protease serine 3-like n=1 Tax=Athene cunicularia TaxID=194338 RepID=UPI000EF6FB3B|nr:transmembrane protease serine 3-like [Athene cunicularia]